MAEFIAIVEALIIWWGAMQYGELEAEHDRYKAATEQCAIDRGTQRTKEFEVEFIAARAEETVQRVVLGSEQRTKRLSQSHDDPCLDSGFVLGRDIIHDEQRSSDILNEFWMRDAGSMDEPIDDAAYSGGTGGRR